MTASVFAAYVDALKPALAARPGLAGVRIAKEPQGDVTAPREFIEVGDVAMEFPWATMPRGMDELGRIAVVARVLKPGQNEAVAKSARDRIVVLVAEIQTALTDNPKLGVANVISSRMARGRIEQTFDQDGRICRAVLEIEVMARIN